MAQRTRSAWPFNRSRGEIISEADRLFAIAKVCEAKAEIVSSPLLFWWRAGFAFEGAATHYRHASLGLIAKVAYEQAIRCYGHGDRTSDSARCGTRLKRLVVHLEETARG